jgi:hypothetical protein
VSSGGATQSGKHILCRVPIARGPEGPAGRSGGLQGRVGWHNRLGQLGGIPGKVSNGNWFSNFN